MVLVIETFDDSIVVRGNRTDIEIPFKKSAFGEFIGEDIYNNYKFNLGNDLIEALKLAGKLSEVL